jgi:hypothetical protein
MGFVDITPDATIGGYPLISSVTGAATRHAALADASDATYVLQETASSVDGIDIYGFSNPTIPAGAVVTGAELHARGAHFYPNGAVSFGVQAPPKPQYVSPYGPDPFALAQTPLGTDVGTWFFAYPYDLSINDFVIQYNPTFQYNNGFYAWDQLTWNQVDLNSLRMLVGWHTPASGAGTNRLHRIFLRIFYDSPPTVSGVQPADLSAGQTFTTTPTITWTYADTEGNVQNQSRVIVVKDDAADNLGNLPGTTNFNPETASVKAYDSGLVAGASNTKTVTPTGLVNLSNYYAYVKVYHAPNQGIEMASAWTGSAVFQVNGTPPNGAVFAGNPVADNVNQRIIIEVRTGSWNATPYPNYFDITKLVDSVNGTTEYVRGGLNVSKMTLLATGSDAGNDIVTPHAAALNITGDKQISVCIAKNGAVPSQGFYLFSKADGLGTMYQFRVNSSSQMVFEWWNGASLQTSNSTTIPWPADKTAIWLRVNHVTASNWHSDFYYSLDPPETSPAKVVYTNLSNFTGSGSGVTTAINSTVEVNRTTAGLAAGFRVYYAEIRNGIAATSPVIANPDFREQTIGVPTFTDSTGKVWTINRGGIFQNFPTVIRYDYEEPQGISRFYLVKAITVAAGSPVASAVGVGLSPGLATDGNYIWWFKVPLNPTLNKAFSILPGGWDSHRPANAAAFTPLGRPYKVVVSDGVSGNEQTIKVECFSQADYDALRKMYEAQQVVMVNASGSVLQRYFAFVDWNDDRYTIANGYAVVTLQAIEVDRPAIT